MTYQKAISAIMDACNWNGSGQHTSDELAEAKRMVCEATKKQIPKKPEPFERTAHDFQSDVCKHSHYPCEYIKPFNHEYKYTDFKCPVCGKLTKDGTPRFCWCCGQALDWSDTE